MRADISAATTSILRPPGSPPKANVANSRIPHARPPRTTPTKRTDKKSTLPIPPLIIDNSHGRRNGETSLSRQVPISNNTDLETISAPGSVLLVNPHLNVSLTRELSDLSGSYLNGTTSVGPGVNAKVPGSVYQSDQSTTSYQRPWRHAKVLSSLHRQPQHPQPHSNDDLSVGGAISRTKKFIAGSGASPNSPYQPEVSIELIQAAIENGSSPIALTALVSSDSTYDQKRMPLLLLLMDTQRKLYELMQIWIDSERDSVGSIIQTLQQNIGDTWRQDYDGAFQVRNNHFSQLIHILLAAKYDVQPYELWVAKPWSMSAKATVSYASGLLNHLKRIGVLAYTKASEQNTWKHFMLRASNQQPNNHSDDTILVLCQEAQRRINIPSGIMKHHHACQFLTFSPPFETTGTIRVDVLAGDAGTETDGESVPSQLSDSHCGFSLECESEDNDMTTKNAENDSILQIDGGQNVNVFLPSVVTHQNVVISRSQIPDLSKSVSIGSNAETATSASQSPMLASHRKRCDDFESASITKSHEANQEVTLQEFQRNREPSRAQQKRFRKRSWLFSGLCCNKCDEAVELPDEIDDNDSIHSYRPPTHNNMYSPQAHGSKSHTASRTLLSSSSSNTHRNNGLTTSHYNMLDLEDGGMSTDGHSTISDSAPLLFTRPF